MDRIKQNINLDKIKKMFPVKHTIAILCLFFLFGIKNLIITIALMFIVDFILSRVKQFNTKLTVPRDGAVLITGASSGIGYEAALDLNKNGWAVFAGTRKGSDFEKLKQKASNSEKLFEFLADVTNEEQLSSATKKLTEVLKEKDLKLYGVINNAGYSEAGPLELQPIEKVRKQFDVNVIAPINIAQKLLPLLRKSGSKERTSRLIFVGSMLDAITIPNTVTYCASKSAIRSISDGFRREVSSLYPNVDVIYVRPCKIRTSFHTNRSKNLKMKEISESEVLKTYQKASDKFELVYEKNPSAPVSVVTLALNNALNDSNPRPYYHAADLFGNVLGYVVGYLPARLVDLLQKFSR